MRVADRARSPPTVVPSQGSDVPSSATTSISAPGTGRPTEARTSAEGPGGAMSAAVVAVRRKPEFSVMPQPSTKRLPRAPAAAASAAGGAFDPAWRTVASDGHRCGPDAVTAAAKSARPGSGHVGVGRPVPVDGVDQPAGVPAAAEQHPPRQGEVGQDLGGDRGHERHRRRVGLGAVGDQPAGHGRDPHAAEHRPVGHHGALRETGRSAGVRHEEQIVGGGPAAGSWPPRPRGTPRTPPAVTIRPSADVSSSATRSSIGAPWIRTRACESSRR